MTAYNWVQQQLNIKTTYKLIYIYMSSCPTLKQPIIASIYNHYTLSTFWDLLFENKALGYNATMSILKLRILKYVDPLSETEAVLLFVTMIKVHSWQQTPNYLILLSDIL